VRKFFSRVDGVLKPWTGALACILLALVAFPAAAQSVYSASALFVQFGSVSAGTNSPTQSVTLTNISSVAQTAGFSWGTFSGDNGFSGSHNCVTVAPSASCQIAFSFSAPISAVAGNRNASFAVPNGPIIALQATVAAQLSPYATVALERGDSYAVNVGALHERTVSVSNAGQSPLVVYSITVASTNPASVNASSVSIAKNQCASAGAGALGANASCAAVISTLASVPFDETFTVTVTHNGANSPTQAVFSVKAQYPKVVEYFVVPLAKYFITGRVSDQEILDALPATYRRTGMQFDSLPATDATALPICRYYFRPPGSNSHFYGAPADCAAVASVYGNDANVVNENLDFSVALPAAGRCPATAPVAVFRSYNNKAVVAERNHRYTVTAARYNQMTAAGWVPEGPAFCVRTGIDANQ
jgi:hypothetical protein